MLNTCIKYSLIILTLGLSQWSLGQELNATVSVRTDKIQATNKRIFETLETSIQEFINNTKWTDVDYAQEEKIECTFLLTIEKFALPGRMQATLQISANRPVYNAALSSTILVHQDKSFSFNYVENAPIIFTPNQFQSNIASVLAYYAYIIIGYDSDSFEQNGGDEYFSLAQDIVSNAQSTSEPGWKSFEDTRNRFWLVDNIQQRLFQPFRDVYYEYHRLGMDYMYKDPEVGRSRILTSLEKLIKVHQAKPLSFNMQIFFNTKQSELISIFKEAPQEEKTKFLEIAKTLDPTRSSNYEEIKK